MRRRLWISLIGTVLIVVGALIGNLATGNTPVLGLDLQGGVSVILQPVEPATEDDLLVIRDLIRSELENRGIAEPDVRVQGDVIVVDLPGVRDQQEALDAVDVSGVVELRPVLDAAACAPPDPTAGVPPAGSILGDELILDGTEVSAGDDATDEATTNETTPSTVLDDSDLDEPQGFANLPATPDTTVPSSDDTVPDEPTDSTVPDLSELVGEPSVPGAELLPSRDGPPVCVGPVAGTGEVFVRGSAELTSQQGWGVGVELRGDGQAVWNNLATQCYNTTPSCPSTVPGLRGQIAIVLDSVVVSAPQVNQPNFTDVVAITGNFSRGEAEDLVSVLNRGAFPVEVEAQEARTVSASAGSESLQAAVIAGLIGLALVLTFLVSYYRWIALVVIGGIAVWAAMVFSVASLVSGWTNYSLSLAGVTGIIVAIGVTVDSYVVFFERMKDELRNGRTLRNAGPRSFQMTWRTIWTADLVSIIGAAILFWLSVGSVRGFALFLGITTACDLLVCFFFTRPAVILLSRSKFMVGRKAFGLEVAR
ncbi:MAG: protein translocase subunit SecD [Ilumatobacteraceae bacterium]|nr:protein translocase subunit SecD [Ilumatobacteraceae bacterium]